jgi:hypothetical protein
MRKFYGFSVRVNFVGEDGATDISLIIPAFSSRFSMPRRSQAELTKAPP